jgi:hypothetical protein
VDEKMTIQFSWLYVVISERALITIIDLSMIPTPTIPCNQHAFGSYLVQGDNNILHCYKYDIDVG